MEFFRERMLLNVYSLCINVAVKNIIVLVMVMIIVIMLMIMRKL